MRIRFRNKVFAFISIITFWSFQSHAQCAVNAGDDTTICAGHKVKLTADTSGGSPTTYTWSSVPAGVLPGNRTITVTPAVTTVYIVSVSGNGCNAVDSVTVTVNPSPPIPVFTYTSDYLCSGTSLTFLTNPDTGLTYKWNFGDGQKDTNILVTHTYYYYGTDTTSYFVKLTVTNTAGCAESYTDTVSVKGIPKGGLLPGTGTDTTTFNGEFTFTRCILSGQVSAGFNFVNNNNPSTGVISTIIWGDTGVTWTADTPWTTISHSYGLGNYNMTYIVSSTVNGCADTLHYKIFVGSNPSVGFGIQGSTSICGLNPIIFYVDNFETNPQGTVYTVTYNDGSPPLVFGQPPPDSIVHLFDTCSCGFSSTNGITTYDNSFSATIVASNPCGITSAQVLPIYVSLPPLPGISSDTVCQGTPSTITNATQNGGYATPSGCSNDVSLLWNVSPNTGWALVGGTLGNDNGYTGVNFDPSLWTSGSNALNIIFDSLGTYNIQLVAANGCGPDTITQNVCITTPPSPSFTLTPTLGCAPFVANAVNTSPPVSGCNAVEYFWDITALSASCANDSVQDYLITGNVNSPAIHFYNEGIYAITLNAQNACGNFASVVYDDTVKDKPQITLTVPGAICVGDSLSPSGTALPCAGTITGYNWTFQGGNPATDTSLNPGSISINTPGNHTVSFSATNECGTRTLTDIVVVDTLPVANAGPDQILCSDSTGQIGAPPVTGWIYMWNPPTGLSSDTSANPTIKLINSGNVPDTATYVLTVSNAGGCTSTDSVTIIVYPQLIVNAGPSKTTCAGTSVQLNGTSGGGTSTVLWSSSNGGTFSNAGSATTSYTPSIDSGTVILTLSGSATGSPCPGQTDSLLLTVNPIPVANAGPDQQICSGSSAQLGVAPVAGISYQWVPVTGLNSGIISNPTVSLINNGLLPDTSAYILISSNTFFCSVSDTVNVVTYPPATASAGLPQQVCTGGSVQLAGSIGGTATSAVWTSSNGGAFSNPDAVNSVFTPSNTSGSTILTLTTNNPPGPCPAASSEVIVTVNPVPVANPGLNDTICNGATAQLGAAAQNGYAYHWSPSTGLTDTAVANPGVILSNPGDSVLNETYILIVSANGCPDTAQVQVSVFPTPQVNAGAPVSICSGDSVTLSATGSGYNALVWSSTSGTLNSPDSLITSFAPNIANGIAVATVTVSQIPPVCPATASSVNVTVNPSPSLITSFTQSICSNVPMGAINLSGIQAGTNFTWTASSPNGVTGFNSSGTGTIIPSQTLVNNLPVAGTVIYTIIPVQTGCAGTIAYDTITVLPLSGFVLPPAQTICSGATSTAVVLTSPVANTSFSWTATGGNGLSGFISSGTGNIPAQSIVNSGNNVDSVVYIINSSAGGCSGGTSDYTIRVEPAPGLIFTQAPQTVCSGQATQLVNISSNVANANISWTALVPAALTGAVTSGTTTIPSQTFYNNNIDSLPVPLTIQYTVQITTTGFACTGATGNYSITIQPVPSLGFEQSQVSGCTPFNVNFLPVSSNYGPPDSLTFVWGDGTANTVLYPNASLPEWTTTPHTFYNLSNQPDTFHIQLIANSECLDTTITHEVVLLPGAVNAFFTDSPATGCNPLQVTFRDQSTGASLLTWCFNFETANDSCAGPGQVDTAGTIFNHTFTTGTYTVALFAIDGYGCAGDTAYQTIDVIPSPVANFSSTDSVCAHTTVSFTNQSTTTGGATIAQINWNFGNGISSSVNSPTEIYDTGGTYQVCLSVSTNFGCADSICKPLTIFNKPVVDFTPQDTCLNTQPIQFLNTSTGASNYAWDFGDGSISFLQNPAHQYAITGTYAVTLVGSSLGCSDTAMHNAVVFPVPVASFTLSEGYNCGAPANVQLTNTSVGTNAYNWVFGNGATSTQVSPATTYTSSGTYLIYLTATNAFGCADTASNPFTVYPLPVVDSINLTPAEGCEPLDVHFSVNGTNANSYIWNFGDGATATTNSPFTSHLYPDTGTYSVSLYVYSFGTCGDTILLPDTVTVHINPTASFDYITSDVIDSANGSVQFINTSLNSTSWFWNFGDGGTSTGQNPLHLFAESNYFNVLLVAMTPYGCIDSTRRDIYVIKKSLYAPNAFAPAYNAGSSLVQVWKPVGMGLQDYHAQIFNKWGELLWESTLITDDEMKSPVEGWDGTYQGKPCQQGVYVWKIEAVFIDGTIWDGMRYKYEARKKTIGDVTLIR